MAATLTTIANMLKVFYLPGMRRAINLGTPLFSQLRRNQENVVGTDFTIAIHSALNEGIGSRREMDTLMDPGEEVYQKTILPSAYTYGKMRISGQSIAASRNDAGAFARGLEHHITGIQLAVRREMERQIFGDGTAQLALVNDAALANATTVTVDNGLSATLGVRRRLRRNMIIDIWDSTGATLKAQNIKITATSASANTLTVASQVTADDDAIIVRQGNRDTNGGKEMMGITGIVDSTGALQSLNPATGGQEFWASYESAVGGNITIPVMLEAVDEIEEEAGPQPNLIVTTAGIRRKYFDLLDDAVRLKPLMLHGGWEALSFTAGGSAIPFLVCPDCPKNVMYFLNTNYLDFYRLHDFDWLDLDGSRLRLTPNKDAWEATLFIYSNLGTDSRHHHGKLRTITE